MKRRSFLAGLTLGGVAGTGLTYNIRRPIGDIFSRPNIILILADDLRWDALGYAGNRIVLTPHIDALARDGSVFSNNFVTTSVCPISRASIFTGQYARKHNIWNFGTPLTKQQMEKTFPFLLRKAGYFTGFIGKWGVGNESASSYFDEWNGYLGQGDYWDPSGQRKEHLTSYQSQKSLEFINKCQKIDRPFFLSVHTKAPHAQDDAADPYQADPQYSALYDGVTIPEPVTATESFYNRLPTLLQSSEGRNRWIGRFDSPEHYQHSVKQYYRLISGIDDLVGNLIDGLKRQGMYEKTAIIFTSDNGYMLGEHGLCEKWFGYEESIRTPLVIKPAFSGLQRSVDAMTLNIDLCPTILSMANVDVPSSVQGKNLLPLLDGSIRQLRDSWFYEHLLDFPTIAKSEGVRTNEFKYMRYFLKDGVFEETLFDIKNDPFEENSLIGNSIYEKKLIEMRRQHFDLLQEVLTT